MLLGAPVADESVSALNHCSMHSMLSLLLSYQLRSYSLLLHLEDGLMQVALEDLLEVKTCVGRLGCGCRLKGRVVPLLAVCCYATGGHNHVYLHQVSVPVMLLLLRIEVLHVSRDSFVVDLFCPRGYSQHCWYLSII